ncbi:MAG TPA: hypothetical protein VFV86_11805, partial [Nitrososphaeraceae archaeon]|nr:hypothetical protein [Nitrososphaeraceae archaeon]
MPLSKAFSHYLLNPNNNQLRVIFKSSICFNPFISNNESNIGKLDLRNVISYTITFTLWSSSILVIHY